MTEQRTWWRSAARTLVRQVSWVFYVALSLLLLFAGQIDDRLFNAVNRATLTVSEPLMTGLSWPAATVGDVSAWFRDQRELVQENRRLIMENRELHAVREQAHELQIRLDRYHDLLNVKVGSAVGAVTGRVVSAAGGPFFRTLVVNAGSGDGIRQGAAAVGPDGLVGRVVSTAPNASQILLLTDFNSRIPVVAGPARHRAILSGGGGGFLPLNYLATNAALTIGDRVVTSGHGELLPPDLPVGTVVDIVNGLPMVRPFTDFDTISFVRLLHRPDERFSASPPPLSSVPESPAGASENVRLAPPQSPPQSSP